MPRPARGQRATFARVAAVVLLCALVAGWTGGAGASAPSRPVAAARGATSEEACRSVGLHAVPAAEGPTFCSHGVDRRSDAFGGRTPETQSAIAARQPIGCNGTGTDGARVQVMYVRAGDQPDRYGSASGTIRQMVEGVDAIFQDSAARAGGARQVRWVTDSSCRPAIDNVVLSAGGDDDFGRTIDELRARGYDRDDRKYLAFVDTDQGGICGIGTVFLDDGPSSANANNNFGGYSRVDRGCWTAEVAAHELMHNLGAVQLSAPHTSNGLHCKDDYDVMCYDDGGGPPRVVCAAPGDDRLFDCNHDDYFATGPAAGSYLATHWNTATSRWLVSPAGLLRGTVTVGGSPRAGVWVSVVDIDRSGARPLGTETDSAGQWSIDAGPGRYVVGYFDQAGMQRYEYHDDRLTFAEAYASSRVTVTAGTATTLAASLAPWSPSLRTGNAAILGTVRTPSGAPIPDLWVFAVDATGAAVKGGWTLSTGLFAIGGLPAGNYRLLVADPSGTYRFEWFDDARSFEGATVVSVLDGRLTGADPVLAAD